MSYFEQGAKPWEALTYLKLRFVAGDRTLADRAVEASRRGIERLAAQPHFEAELQEMRARIEEREASPSLKSGAGGTYDLDYLTGALQARHRVWLAGNLRDRLRLLQNHGLFEVEEYAILTQAAIFLRTIEHIVRLVTGSSGKWLPVSEHAHRSVQKLLAVALGDEEALT